MFQQFPEWHSKISIRAAIWSSIGFGFGFSAGLAFGVLVDRFVWLRTTDLGLLFYTAACLAAAVRFYFLAMSRVREHSALTGV